MKKLLLSVLTLTLVATAAIVGTQAYFTDEEESLDNTFIAGTLDLRVDSTAHYNGMVCTVQTGGTYVWVADGSVTLLPMPELEGQPCEGTWDEKDLAAGDRFFALEDVKPGDWGENTISLHLDDNPGYLRLSILNVEDLDNTCTEPEDIVDATCGVYDFDGDGDVEAADDYFANAGELSDHLLFSIWVDEGSVAGWQNSDDDDTNDDLMEGDNIFNGVETYLFQDASASDVVGADTIWNAGVVDGGTVQYLGVGWRIPAETDNVIQSDSFVFDVLFEVEQARHNDTPFI